MKKPIGIDLFCGVGGMSLGFKAAGFKIVSSFDFDPIHVETYKKNFPETNVMTADVSKLTGKSIRKIANIQNEDIDVLFGGPPCQGFSSIGKRDSDDVRNKLVMDFARLVRELQPKFFVMENVAGFLFSSNKSLLKRLLRSLKKSGYEINDSLCLLNAKDFGVAQHRRRIFILGARKGLPVPKYPLPTHRFPKTVKDALSGLPNVDRFKYLLDRDNFNGKYAKTNYSSFLDNELSIPGKQTKLADLQGCSRTVHSKETVRRFDKTEPGTREDISRFVRLSLNDVAPTLRAGTGPANGSHTAPRPIHPQFARCITVREGARLHSFPDWFQFHPTKWHGFRQVGNSVPPLMAKAVANSLLEAIKIT